MQSIIGHLLLWTGFLSGSLAAVFRTNRTDVPWLTINWYWFGASIAVGIAGVIALRRRRSSAALQTRMQGSLSQIQGNLDQLVSKMHDLQQQHPNLTPRQTLDYIDHQLADHFREFGDGRNAITAAYGLETFAEVMSGFAASERYINRVWSASADGYVDEASSYIDLSLNELEAAQRVMHAKRQAAASPNPERPAV
jgi:hypothetical protein